MTKMLIVIILGVIISVAILVLLVVNRRPAGPASITWSTNTIELGRRVPVFRDAIPCAWAVVLTGTSGRLPSPSTATLVGTCQLPSNSLLMKTMIGAGNQARGESLANYLLSQGCPIPAGAVPVYFEHLSDVVCDGTAYINCEIAIDYQSGVVVFSMVNR